MLYVAGKFYKNITFKTSFLVFGNRINTYLIRNAEYKSKDQIPISKIPRLTSSQVIALVVSVHFYKVLGDRPTLVRIPDCYPT